MLAQREFCGIIEMTVVDIRSGTSCSSPWECYPAKSELRYGLALKAEDAGVDALVSFAEAIGLIPFAVPWCTAPYSSTI